MKQSFEEFKEKRFRAAPFDFPNNPTGFPYRTEGSSDISAHLPLLQWLAGKCSHVTEFGVRDAYSTAAFIGGCCGRVVSYDINRSTAVDELMNTELPCKWEFHQQNTIDPTLRIEETELLCIDSLHTFSQIQKELELHGNKSTKYLVFHDTFSQGKHSLDVPGAEGINRAIAEFLQNNVSWSKTYEVNFNHGLTILENTLTVGGW